MNYKYMNEKGKAESDTPVIVIHDTKTKTVFGHMANCKGSADGWVVKRILTDMEDMGYSGTKVVFLHRVTQALVPMLCWSDAMLLPSQIPTCHFHIATVLGRVFVVHCLGELDVAPVVCTVSQSLVRRVAVSLDLEVGA